jgi:hypothetical protein
MLADERWKLSSSLGFKNPHKQLLILQSPSTVLYCDNLAKRKYTHTA